MVMGRNYNQWNIENRVMIEILQAHGNSVREIGRKLGRSHSTIVRELKRDTCPVHDQDNLAHHATDSRLVKEHAAELEAQIKEAI